MSFIYNGQNYNVAIDPTSSFAYYGIILARGNSIQFPNNVTEVKGGLEYPVSLQVKTSQGPITAYVRFYFPDDINHHPERLISRQDY
jgi:hypothetical protein